MYKLILFSFVLFYLVGCCDDKNNKKLPTKIDYIRIGFDSGKESCIRINGTGKYKIRYGDELVQQVYDETCSCDVEIYQVIADNVIYFSVITEEEYNRKTE